MKGEISNKTIIVGDFNTPITPMDISTKENYQGNTNFKWYNRPVRPNWYL